MHRDAEGINQLAMHLSLRCKHLEDSKEPDLTFIHIQEFVLR